MKTKHSLLVATVALTTLAGLTASCSTVTPANGKPSSAMPTSYASKDHDKSTAVPFPSPSNPAATTPAATPAPTSAPTPEPKPEPKPEYKLNGNYDVVPLQPTGNKKVVLLTFDDGPKQQEIIEKLLAALDKHNAKAIFFVNGYRVKQNPELLKLLHERGQIIGNHSWDHIDLKLEKPEKVDRQIQDVQVIVKETIGVTPVFFRPPYGSGGEYVKQRAKEEGLLFMTWSNGSEDWVEAYKNPQGVIKRVLEQLHNGSNILMHEVPWTAEALDDLLTQLEGKGYSFVDPRSIRADAAP